MRDRDARQASRHRSPSWTHANVEVALVVAPTTRRTERARGKARDYHSMKNKSRNDMLMWMAEHAYAAPSWTFLTNHAQVLVSIARDPGVRLRDIGVRVGITERATHRIVAELADAGYTHATETAAATTTRSTPTSRSPTRSRTSRTSGSSSTSSPQPTGQTGRSIAQQRASNRQPAAGGRLRAGGLGSMTGQQALDPQQARLFTQNPVSVTGPSCRETPLVGG